jgi:hypothetical protein
MSIEIVFNNETTIFPEKFIPYSGVVKNMRTANEEEQCGSDSDGSGDEEDETTYQIKVEKSTPETLGLLFKLMDVHYKEDHSNTTPQPKKVTASKFKIEEELGSDTLEFMEEAGKDAICAIAILADYLSIQLVTHLCYTWIAHQLNTLETTEKMEYLGIEGEPPTFEQIMEVNLETCEVPSIPSVNKENEGGACK